MYFKTAEIEGLRLFYREAGEPSKPTIVLLHGFPRRRTSSTISFRFWRTGFMSSRPTTPAWGSAKLRHDCPATDLR
jgi:pimeloyl-ACP methyl ester carboxylesterase